MQLTCCNKVYKFVIKSKKQIVMNVKTIAFLYCKSDSNQDVCAPMGVSQCLKNCKIVYYKNCSWFSQIFYTTILQIATFRQILEQCVTEAEVRPRGKVSVYQKCIRRSLYISPLIFYNSSELSTYQCKSKLSKH